MTRRKRRRRACGKQNPEQTSKQKCKKQKHIHCFIPSSVVSPSLSPLRKGDIRPPPSTSPPPPCSVLLVFTLLTGGAPPERKTQPPFLSPSLLLPYSPAVLLRASVPSCDHTANLRLFAYLSVQDRLCIHREHLLARSHIRATTNHSTRTHARRGRTEEGVRVEERCGVGGKH